MKSMRGGTHTARSPVGAGRLPSTSTGCLSPTQTPTGGQSGPIYSVHIPLPERHVRLDAAFFTVVAHPTSTIRFDATATGTKSAAVSTASNDPKLDLLTFTVSSNGFSPPARVAPTVREPIRSHCETRVGCGKHRAAAKQ